MELVGHRGCGAVNPENTVRAIRNAAGRLPAVEVDVRRCGSGELVCVHDETVDRVTGGSGRVEDLSLDALRALDVQGSGEPIPTLAEVVDAVPPETTLQVELKETGIGAEALSLLEPLPSVRVSSFDPDALEAVRDADVPTGYLFEGDPVENVALAERLGCANVHPHWRTCAETGAVGLARDRGLGVYAWGAGMDAEAVAAAREAGADGITVDHAEPATQ